MCGSSAGISPVVAHEPENASLLGRVGQRLISMGDMAEAISVLTRASDAGADPKTVQLLATLLYRGGYYAEPCQHFNG
jgi:hypothetical protein